MGEDVIEIKKQFNDLIEQMNDNNTPDRGELDEWKREIRDLETVMQEMFQESADATQSPEYRKEKKREYFEMSEVCDPLLEQANELHDSKSVQYLQNSMAGGSIAKRATAASDSDSEGESQSKKPRHDMGPPPPGRKPSPGMR